MTTSIRAEIIISAKDLATTPLKKVGQTTNTLTKDLKKGFGDAAQTLTGFNVASLGVAGAIGGLAMGLKFAIGEAMEAERIMALTESTIKATGSAAGLTADQIGAMSMRLSLLNAVDDETIQSATNLMLTFKKVRGEGFEPAMQAAIDMSVILGTDLRSSTMMLGKALEDPVRGITALRRAGVSFTAEQQKVIKALVDTGKAAEAQALILQELNTQVGGAGAAAADTMTGQMDAMKIQFGNVAQMAGSQLIPALKFVADGFMFGTQAAGTLNLAMQGLLGIISPTQVDLRLAALRAGDLTAVYTEQAEVVERVDDKTEDYAFRLGVTQRKTVDVVTATSDMAHGYQRMGEAANDLGDGMEGINLILEEQARQMQALVDAGLDGTITNAFDDYKDVIAETQPEIDKLTRGIEWMLSQQGKTYTVTTAATASLAEYELAQIKAATALQKFNEFSGDSREEQLELQIASDLAAEKVGKLGEAMGISQSYTADYTKRLLEANGELQGLVDKQAAAEAQLHKTTAEFIQQNIILGMTPEAQLEIARGLGLIDEASYNLAKRTQELTLAWDLDKSGLIDTAEEARGLAVDLGHLTNSSVTQAKAAADGAVTAEDFATRLNVYTSPALLNVKDRAIEAADAIGSIESRDVTVTLSLFEKTYKTTYYTQDESMGGAPGQAMGGPVMGGKSYIVGEQGPEVFTPATSGNITANHNLGGGGVRIDNITITVGQGDAAEISRQLASELRRALGNGAGYMGA